MSDDNLSTCVNWTQPPKCFITLGEESQSRAACTGWDITANTGPLHTEQEQTEPGCSCTDLKSGFSSINNKWNDLNVLAFIYLYRVDGYWLTCQQEVEAPQGPVLRTAMFHQLFPGDSKLPMSCVPPGTRSLVLILCRQCFSQNGILFRNVIFCTLANQMEEQCTGWERMKCCCLDVPHTRVFPVTYNHILNISPRICMCAWTDVDVVPFCLISPLGLTTDVSSSPHINHHPSEVLLSKERKPRRPVGLSFKDLAC